MRTQTALYFSSGVCSLLAFSLALFFSPAVFAAEKRIPLLLEGKKTLSQRIVTHPGAVMTAEADAQSAVLQSAVKPFSVFYVYGRKNNFLEVGASSGAAQGWIEAVKATDWPQAMTLLFTERSGRMPVLFFREENTLKRICAADDLRRQLKELEEQAKAVRENKKSVPDLPVLATEPFDHEGAVSRKRFYLMPVKSMSEPFEGAKFLQVASIDPGDSGKNNDKQEDAKEKNNDKPDAMRTGIVFVIDTTISMKPYIDQSLNVIRSAFNTIEKEHLGESVGFAVIAFRNSTAKNPKVGYVTQKVRDFTTLKERKLLEDALGDVEEATASTHSYDEDSMAGVKAAIDELNWEAYQSRVLVLISDAGPLPPGDPLAATRMAPAEMLDYAKSKNIWLTVLHVRAPSGAKDHEYAEKAYRELTKTASGSSSYMPIPAPTPATGAVSFAKTAQTLAESLTKVVKATSLRKLPEKPKLQVKTASPEDEARRIGASIGYAMQLEFIGRQKENRAPGVVDAWIADMDLAQLAEHRYVPTVEVAILLTKNQLSDLQRTLQIIVDQAERTKKTDSRDFFQSILSASAQMARDPAAFSAKPGRNLQETGVLGEVLEDLPYKSDIMLLKEDDWYRMSVGEQTSFINRLKSRIARYEEYDKDRSNWESFGASDAGDWVYRVPLSVLP
ncbi:MAG: VWA domain-containing protein [Desulfovibrio sp.]|jgi:serine/threonine-protein kinase PpkA|nr:VWA domain-containing protein [Desulfovibrio sp.]